MVSSAHRSLVSELNYYSDDSSQVTQEVEISRSSSPVSDKEYTVVNGPTSSHTVQESSSQHEDLLVSVITTQHLSLVPPSSLQNQHRLPTMPSQQQQPSACATTYDCGVADMTLEEVGEDVDDNLSTSSSVSQGFFLDSADFLESTWASVVDDTNMHVGMGMLAIATTAVIVHPLILVAGAGVAAASFWAVGVFGEVLNYEYFSDSTFTQLFWKDTPALTASTDTPSQDDSLKATEDQEKPLDLKTSRSSRSELSEETPQPALPLASLDSVVELPAMLEQHRSESSIDDFRLDTHFPPLKNEIVSEVQMPGLNALKFFEVFFSDEAPFTFKEFQKKRGDIDIVYGPWGPCKKAPASLHHRATGPLLDNMQERTLSFKTLTKSYFGPAYASATKTQRVTIHSKRLVILESRTRLEGIPFCDRFQVVERWIAETPKHKGRHSSLLKVSTEVQFKNTCSFESQIRKKSFSTVTEVVTSWCEMAKEALERTAAQSKRKLRHEDDGDEGDLTCGVSADDSKEQLFARHEERLRQLELDVLNGESIEVQHEGDSSFVIGELAEKPLVQKSSPRRSRSARAIGSSVRQVFSRKSSLLNKSSHGR